MRDLAALNSMVKVACVPSLKSFACTHRHFRLLVPGCWRLLAPTHNESQPFKIYYLKIVEISQTGTRPATSWGRRGIWLHGVFEFRSNYILCFEGWGSGSPSIAFEST